MDLDGDGNVLILRGQPLPVEDVVIDLKVAETAAA